MEYVTFKSLLENLNTFNTWVNITLWNIFVSIFASLLVAVFIWYIYKKTFSWVLYSKNFNLSLILMSLITTIVIITISWNLILSLWMVWALSIVRFRTAIKDPMDLTFMFWAIWVWIINWAWFYKLAIFWSLMIWIIIFIFNTKLTFKVSYLCIIKTKEKEIAGIKKHIKHIVPKYDIRSIQYNWKETELIIEMNLKEWDEIKISDRLNQIKDIDSVHIVTYTWDVETVS